ncbi:hypothetical protein CEUSTIGMA_g2573.t1 [Chlamydomonas eustigma]|uniref:Nucleotide-diphospho-sugar transferase domain-containing protein n=1 Tax=Chlamydomonas eustigma TaxID=1157962 RepID=A0A250WWQ1_9CHLO|nr:hypothetical protein CEUSTIGMA_g2573.t1 [Chlamydomonas eustigma]|eukprot:GAX75129.1 hypothetical protein CEUSTIGMA_g2573.t1 [Chlamydomonas eustigma]
METMRVHSTVWLCFLIVQTLTWIPSSNGSNSVTKWTIGQIEDPPDDAPVCLKLSKEHLSKFSEKNTVLVTVVDQIIMRKFGKSWVENVKSAGIKYWLVAALDPWVSKVLGHWGISQCFNAPMDRLRYKGADTSYKWGSMHWHETTWNKVYVIAAVHELGFNVIHSDMDVTWFQDPMPFFSKHLAGPVHGIFATDALETRNQRDDQGLESMTSPHININTGMYFLRYFPEGKEFFKAWFSMKAEGHDQDGFNTMSRGSEHRGNRQLPSSHPNIKHGQRMFGCALHNTSLISFLPVSMFGNAYTYVVGQVHKQLNHPLYAVHWVWSGSTMESKQQTIRDAMKFWDPPEYYSTPSLVTMDLWVPELLSYHASCSQFRCFCAKNWYMTQSCRINGEPHSTFPYDCALSHVMRVKKLLHGMTVSSGKQQGAVTIREHTFMDNPNVPDEIKKSRLVLEPAAERRLDKDVTAPPSASLQDVVKLPDGSFKLTVPWPLDVEELKDVLKEILPKFRVVHLSNATKLLSYHASCSQFRCFCAKNWYMTQSCRINGEPHSTFPYDCALSHVMRVKKLLHGMTVSSGKQQGAVTIREHTFMDNPNVPDEIKKSRLVLEPAAERRLDKDVTAPPSASLQDVVKLPDGSFKLTVPWPLDVEELKDVLNEILPKFRVVHLSNATKILERGFHDPQFHLKFDEQISKMATRWCCRSPKDQERYNATDFSNLRILPISRDPTASSFKAVFGIESYMAGYNNNYLR